MNKINFQNLPNTTTPVNATNLNLLQTNIENDINTKSTYSTTETVVGEWLGKPLYRKVIDCGNLPNSDYKDVAHNISNLGYVTKLYLAVSTGTSFYEANMTGTSSVYSGGTVVVRANDTNIQIGTTTNYSSHTAYAVIEYTKTTD